MLKFVQNQIRAK